MLNIFAVLLVHFLSSAQVTDTSNRVQVAFAVENPAYKLSLGPRVGSGTPLEYRPNTRSLSGIEASYKGLAFGYLTKAPMTPTDEMMYGTTEYDDYRTILSLGQQKQWFLLGYYNRYKGLYVENSPQLGISSVAGVNGISTFYYQRPDLSVANAGAGAVYVFNPQNFSASAAIFQTARQTKSGGSLLMMGSWDNTVFSADSAIIPAQIQSAYGKDAAMTRGEFTSANLSGGFGYTLVANQTYFLTGIGLIGAGYQWRKYGTDSAQSTDTAGTEKLSWMFSAGQNADNYFLGAGYIQDRVVYRTESLQFTSSISTFRFFVGVRI